MLTCKRVFKVLFYGRFFCVFVSWVGWYFGLVYDGPENIMIKGFAKQVKVNHIYSNIIYRFRSTQYKTINSTI